MKKKVVNARATRVSGFIKFSSFSNYFYPLLLVIAFLILKIMKNHGKSWKIMKNN